MRVGEIFCKIISGSIVNDGVGSRGAAWGDYDNDGWPDLFAANGGTSSIESNFLYHNTGTGTFERVTSGTIANDTGYFVGCVWGDYDNDGFLDLFVAQQHDQNNKLYHNNGDGTFNSVIDGSIVNDGGYSIGCAWADYDKDGFLDLFVANGAFVGGLQNNFLYHNDGNSNAWLRIKCVGGASNRSAIGAKVRVKASIGGQAIWQLREINPGNSFCGSSLDAHFGLGDAANVDILRIEWPSGIVQTMTNVAAKRFLTITEPPLLQISKTNGNFQLMLTGGIGFNYGIEASTNLVAWTSISTLTNTNRVMQFVDPAASNVDRRFYRALVL